MLVADGAGESPRRKCERERRLKWGLGTLFLSIPTTNCANTEKLDMASQRPLRLYIRNSATSTLVNCLQGHIILCLYPLNKLHNGPIKQNIPSFSIILPIPTVIDQTYTPKPTLFSITASNYCLRPLPSNPSRQLHVFGHDCHSFGVNSTQIGVFEETYEVGLSGFLQG